MNYLKRNKNIIIFLSIILVIGLGCGIILGIYQSSSFKDLFTDNKLVIKDMLLNNDVNNILPHLLTLLFLLISNSLVITYLFSIIYLFYNGLAIGFNIYLLMIIYGFKGILFSILYNIVFKLIFISLLLFFLIKGLLISKQIYLYFISNKLSLKKYLKKNYLVSLSIILLICIIDVIFKYNGIHVTKYLIGICGL